MDVVVYHILKEVKKVIRELTFTHKYWSINNTCQQNDEIYCFGPCNIDNP